MIFSPTYVERPESDRPAYVLFLCVRERSAATDQEIEEEQTSGRGRRDDRAFERRLLGRRQG